MCKVVNAILDSISEKDPFDQDLGHVELSMPPIYYNSWALPLSPLCWSVP